MSGDGAWTVEVDRSVCVGNGMCAASAPTVFEIVDGKSRARAGKMAPSAEVVDAYESCPVSAIVVRDETGEEIEPEV